MSKAGQRILKSAKQALAYAKGETTAGFVAHVPEDVDVKEIRRTLKLTQEQFAGRFGFVVATLRDWEQKRFVPDRAARAFLKLIKHEPHVVERVLSTPEPRRAPKGRQEARA